jgi:hypothetical protein
MRAFTVSVPVAPFCSRGRFLRKKGSDRAPVVPVSDAIDYQLASGQSLRGCLSRLGAGANIRREGRRILL